MTASGTPFTVADMPLTATFLNGTSTGGIELDGVAVDEALTATPTWSYGNAHQALASGDVNGDGIADILIGAIGGTGGAGSGPGVVYGVFGTKSSMLPVTTVSTTSGSAAATVASYTGLMVGQTVYSANIPVGTTISACGGTAYAAACTQTGITLSANATATAAGTALNVTSTPLGSTFLNGSSGVALATAGGGNEAGAALAVGDVNGDGIGDLIIGLPGLAQTGNAGASGTVYVLFGTKSGWTTSATPTTLNNTFLNGTDGAVFAGASTNYSRVGA